MKETEASLGRAGAGAGRRARGARETESLTRGRWGAKARGGGGLSPEGREMEASQPGLGHCGAGAGLGLDTSCAHRPHRQDQFPLPGKRPEAHLSDPPRPWDMALADDVTLDDLIAQ